MDFSAIKSFATSPAGLLTGAAVLSAAATAIWVQVKARRAEREHPPSGKFVEVEGVRLHYTERGEGPPVVLIHGNTVSLGDFEASGLIDRLAKDHRVIAIDRPGFGHSSRPRDRLWTPSAQASLLNAALAQLEIERPVVVGHSLGTMVALAMALDYPADVRSLVLLGGYYYPTVRYDALLTAPVALPILGDTMRYTVTAVSGRVLIKRLVKGMFAPSDVPFAFFSALSREMMLRPVQIRANAEDAAFMMPAAKASSERYKELRMPVTIFAGAADMVIDAEAHSARLHGDVPHSKLIVVPDTGHMVHYEVPQQIVAVVNDGSRALPALQPADLAAA
jgi:pimeloyl-ACP methyl ester carboxylesterase